jgi:hypothetical protein
MTTVAGIRDLTKIQTLVERLNNCGCPTMSLCQLTRIQQCTEMVSVATQTSERIKFG